MLENAPAFSGFSVQNLDEAKQFYGNTLGLKLEEQPGMGFHILANGTKVFVYDKPNHEPAGFTVLNFAVDDIDAAVDALTAQGIVFATYDGLHQDAKGIARGKAAGQGPDIAWFTDPSGNVLAVLEN